MLQNGGVAAPLQLLSAVSDHATYPARPLVPFHLQRPPMHYGGHGGFGFRGPPPPEMPLAPTVDIEQLGKDIERAQVRAGCVASATGLGAPMMCCLLAVTGGHEGTAWLLPWPLKPYCALPTP